MSLLYIEGFEGYADAQDVTAVGTSACRFTSIGTNLSLSTSIYRTTQVTPANSRSLNATGGSTTFTISVPSKTELLVGFGVNITSTTAASYTILNVVGTSLASQGIALAFNASTGLISVHVGAGSGSPGTLLGTATGTYSNNVWLYIEMRVKLGSATGEVQLKVNGVEVLNLTNVNTATGSLTAYSVIGKATAQTVGAYYDDLYVCDTLGTTNNTFLGPISVYTLMPTGAGSSTQLTPVGAASNWQAVAEATADTTTYVETSTTGQKDYYAFEALPAGATTIFGVATRARATTPDNGGRKAKFNLKNGANVISSTLRALTLGSWLYEFFLSETAPDGSAWTKTSVDSSEAGVEAQ